MFVRRMKNIAEAGTVVEIVKVERNCLHLSNGKLLRLPGAADYIAVGERRPMELRQGDVIQFQVNLREQKIFNGNLARITGTPGMVELLNQDMNPVADGLRCLPSDFAGYDYGWVTTSHKSQGRTARHVVIAAQKLDRKAFYVSCSRGRGDRLKWEADSLAEERRRNPISDAQRHVLADLHKEGRLERMPSELSMREASALMANILRTIRSIRCKKRICSNIFATAICPICRTPQSMLSHRKIICR